MNGDVFAKFIWACAFLFVYSLAGETFLFKTVKMDLIREEKIRHNCQTNQNNYISIFAYKYISIRSNLRWLLIIWGIFTYLQIFFQLYCSRVNYRNYNNKFCMASPEVVIQSCSVKKLLLKLTQNSQENTSVEVSF